jgi:hypothetical protein
MVTKDDTSDFSGSVPPFFPFLDLERLGRGNSFAVVKHAEMTSGNQRELLLKNKIEIRIDGEDAD